MSALTINAEPNSTVITYTRDFAATPELILRAHTEADLLAQWLGPGDHSMTVEKLDARHGGAWRYYSTGENGETYAFHGVFHNEPSVADGMFQTFEFEGMPGHVVLERMAFEDLGNGMTRLHGTSAYMTVEDRDGMVESGMESGMADGYTKLDALLKTLQADA